MKQILIDIGNSFIKIATLKNKKFDVSILSHEDIPKSLHSYSSCGKGVSPYLKKTRGSKKVVIPGKTTCPPSISGGGIQKGCHPRENGDPDRLSSSRKQGSKKVVIPAKAGIQSFLELLDPPANNSWREDDKQNPVPTTSIDCHPSEKKFLISSVHPAGKAIAKQIPNSKLITIKDVPMKCKYNKNQLGIDRLLCAFGGLKFCEPPFVVVDCGSAITVDYVDKNKTFIGGIISPGINTMLESLENILSVTNIKQNKSLGTIPQSTQSAVINGVFHSAIGAIKSAHELYSKIAKTKLPLLITGGSAKKLLPHLKELKPKHIEHLIFEGMNDTSL